MTSSTSSLSLSLSHTLGAGPIGLGCMGMSEFYGQTDDAQSLRTLAAGIEAGCLLDTADAYGPQSNERLIARAVAAASTPAVIATKFGQVRTDGGALVRIDGSPAYVRQAAEASLRRLGLETIDVYFQHRLDPKVPIEETVGAMAELVTEGKVRHLGLCEVSASTLRRAHAVHPIAALQIEYSLWERSPEVDVLPTTQALGVSLVAYAPLGRGMLTGAIRSREDLAPGDWRLTAPRFAADTVDANLALVQRIHDLAAASDVAPSQLALAWLLGQNHDILPIPGTRHSERLAANLAAAKLELTSELLEALDAAAPVGAAIGERYPAAMMTTIDR
ncbi:Aldo-keto reductase IolS [Baekduia alba]|uniref:aldo/keto reductase n=1 Tax=Baekduia alba TaxID=2997333 RepID=UPI002340EA76|nr:aldo/keto reductase [Baekduia alba]WCB95405.1 Aldo-keto reductase IolS [Baekduia alba]